MMTENERSEMNDELNGLVAKGVTVAVSTLGHIRDGFHTQMSIKGELQNLPDTDQYRVVVPENPNAMSNSDQTYVYFKASDVYLINPLVSTGVVIYVRIDTPPEGEI
tara:strand:- start:809 stop:1129 length:321 start_codon:yes stop_codon:yes gene_type:complete